MSVEDILVARARRLAQAVAGGEDRDARGGGGVAALVCRVRDEQYAVALAVLEAVRPAAGLVPVPCTPPFVAGLLNVRGEIVTVLDLAAALGLPANTVTGAGAGGSSVVLLQVPRPSTEADARGGGDTVRLGLLVDGIEGVQTLAGGDLVSPLSGNDFTRGVAGSALVLLDVERLLASGRFEVLEDVA
jgi:purine-binding chemotaxis protein CheW